MAYASGPPRTTIRTHTSGATAEAPPRRSFREHALYPPIAYRTGPTETIGPEPPREQPVPIATVPIEPAEPVREDPPMHLEKWRNTTRWLALITIILGIVAFLTPSWGPGSTASVWNAIIVGIVVMILGAIALWAAWTDRPGVVQPAALVSVIAGIWLVVAPLWLFQSFAYFLTHVIVGALLIIMAGSYLGTTTRLESYADDRRHLQYGPA